MKKGVWGRERKRERERVRVSTQSTRAVCQWDKAAKLAPAQITTTAAQKQQAVGRRKEKEKGEITKLKSNCSCHHSERMYVFLCRAAN